MAYNRPDVYFEEIVNQEKPIKVLGTSLAGFVGIAHRGSLTVPFKCDSWTEFVNKTSLGLSSPFMATYDLAYAVYTFFLNGGNSCYISRAAHSTAEYGTAKCPVTTGAVFTAIDQGTWANGFYVKVTANAITAANFDVATYDGNPDTTGTLLETISNVSNTTTSDRYYGVMYNGVSKYFDVTIGSTLEAATSEVFAAGVDGKSDVDDTDYTDALALLAGTGVNIVAVPGQTSTTVNDAISTFCAANQAFGVLDVPSTTNVANAVIYKASLTATDYSALYYPWVNVTDPLSASKAVRLIPPSGFVMGKMAETDTNRGVHKAPAGIETALKGVISMERTFSTTDLDTLNPAAVNAIVYKTGYGTVIWGARTLSTGGKPYVSDTRFDINIETSVVAGTAWVVFEPNDEDLWTRFSSALESFLYSQWKDARSLKGLIKADAYYVKCDAELNTSDTIALGQVIAEIGYARKTPAEFVIIKVMHKT